ncbi:sugar transferase [Facklamia miroungae]|uniref:Exopolysaccharide biosynthesis polyprenyl glycosylphosphotransferase n=1 Tax=Facklamia miroungae TaxID=120956 RepID=A0A1G7SHU3_9LACT|nr:sugar transferase [Facklamia miroungae]NKZ29648.1 sugar transferase [Facklamia miroungae]SDG22558.1 exopolysaccharide biosynthesis polyprenyl glycosylphosphotransferase [Facklamia miroungae]
MNHRKEWNNLLRFVVAIMGSLVCLLSILLSFYLKFAGQIPSRNFIAFESSYLWIALGFIFINFLFGTYIFYNKTLMDLFYFTMLSQLFLSFFMMAVTYAGSWLTFPRSVILLNFFVGTSLLFLFNAMAYVLYHRLSGRKRVLVIGENQKALNAVINFDRMSNRRHEVTHVALSNYYQRVVELSDEVDIVYLTGYIEETERLKIFDYLMRNNKKLFLSTNFANLMMVNPNIMSFEDESLIEVSTFSISFEQAIIKRSIDIASSLILLFLASPIMLITAIAVKLDSKGPIFYRQVRITKGSRPFNILKFRSMTQTAEDESGPVLASSNDARVTRVGKFIRTTRIDELPQLINVLVGDMSLVGPRPERPFFVNQFNQENAYYDLRHHVRAGITGYAQVYGKYATDFNNKLNFDLLYIKNYSIAFDFKLLFQTIKILFDKVSSRGVDEENVVIPTWEDFRSRIIILD